MKKRLISVIFAAVLALCAIAFIGCDSESNDAPQQKVTEADYKAAIANYIVAQSFSADISVDNTVVEKDYFDGNNFYTYYNYGSTPGERYYEKKGNDYFKYNGSGSNAVKTTISASDYQSALSVPLAVAQIMTAAVDRFDLFTAEVGYCAAATFDLPSDLPYELKDLKVYITARKLVKITCIIEYGSGAEYDLSITKIGSTVVTVPVVTESPVSESEFNAAVAAFTAAQSLTVQIKFKGRPVELYAYDGTGYRYCSDYGTGTVTNEYYTQTSGSYFKYTVDGETVTKLPITEQEYNSETALGVSICAFIRQADYGQFTAAVGHLTATDFDVPEQAGFAVKDLDVAITNQRFDTITCTVVMNGQTNEYECEITDIGSTAVEMPTPTGTEITQEDFTAAKQALRFMSANVSMDISYNQTVVEKHYIGGVKFYHYLMGGDGSVTEEYFEKDGSDCYKYTKNGSSWTKSSAADSDVSSALNLITSVWRLMLDAQFSAFTPAVGHCTADSLDVPQELGFSLEDVDVYITSQRFTKVTCTVVYSDTEKYNCVLTKFGSTVIDTPVVA